MVVNPYQQYKNTQIETASQERLVLMLYEGAIRFTNLAKNGLEDNNYEDVNNYLVRTQDIINELMNTLNMEAGGEIAQNLYSLYDYMNRRLIEANIKKAKEPMDEVLGFLQELRDTWAEAMKKMQLKPYEERLAVSGGIRLEG